MTAMTTGVRNLAAAPVTVVVLTGSQAGQVASGLTRELRELAAAAFSGPPWSETPAQARQLTDRLLADAHLPHFVLAFAFTGSGPGLTGFSYGVPRRPAPGSPADQLIPAGTEAFEFCELAVRPSGQRRGTGRALHDAVLTASGPQPRWLGTHPGAQSAVRLYRAAGWQTRRLVTSPASGSPRLLMTRSR